MKTLKKLLVTVVVGSLFVVTHFARSQGSAFTYQGQLNSGSGPANGSFDFTFRLYDTNAAGSQVGSTLTNLAVGVSNGLFAITLDFGTGVFPGAGRWLEIGVRTNGVGSFTTLNPRQAVTAAPYSITAGSAVGVTGTIAAGQLTGFIAPANIASGTITSNMLAVGSVTTANLADNAVTLAKLKTANFARPINSVFSPRPQNSGAFGVAVTAVGTDKFIVGAIEDNAGGANTGAAYLYDTNGTLLTTFTNPTPSLQSLFGTAVAAVGTDKVAISAILGDTGTANGGNVYLYDLNGNLITTYVNPSGAAFENFGISLTGVGSDRLLIGASRSGIAAFDGGAAYLFSTNGSLLTTITNPSAVSAEDLGCSVAVVGGDKLLIGANNSDSAFTRGQIFLFTTNGALLTNIFNPTLSGEFGTTVTAVGTDKFAVGSPFDLFGKVYLFGTNGALLNILTNPVASGDNFGFALSTVGTDKILVGARFNSTGASFAGAAYLLDTNGNVLTSFFNPTPDQNDLFGSAVAGVGTTKLVIGALQDSTVTNAGGAAYLFDLNQQTACVSGLAGVGALPGSVTSDSISAGAVTADKIGGVLLASQIPALDASQIGGGILSDAVLSANVATHGANQTFTGSNTFSGALVATNPFNRLGGNGSSLTSLNASNVSSGTLADVRLSTNVPLLNANQTFAGTNLFSGRIGVGLTSPQFPLHIGATLGTAALNNSPQRSVVENATVNGRATLLLLAGAAVTSTATNRVEVEVESSDLERRAIIGTTSDHEVQLRQNNVARLTLATNGDIGIGTGSPTHELEVQSSGDTEIGIKSTDANGHLWTIQSTGVTGATNLDAAWQVIDRTSGGARLLIGTNGNVGIGTTNPTNKLQVNGGITCTALVQTSDRNAKENFKPVSPAETLAKVVTLPVSSWNFKNWRDGRHVGPMAQDFYAAFGLGGSETTITALDAEGVALAAIQGLNEKLEETRVENAELKRRLEKLERILERRNIKQPTSNAER